MKTAIRESITVTTGIETPYEKAFAYISNPRNQPAWAVNFVKEVKGTDDELVMVTPIGDLPFEFRTDPALGSVDIVFKGGGAIPTRVVPNGKGSEFIFTLFRPDGTPDDAWARQLEGLKEELSILKTTLESN